MGEHRSFFACSVCQPGEDYCKENFKRIVSNNGFVLHRNTPQKGTYSEIKIGDILLLKYNNKFVAYGEVIEMKTTDATDWSNWAMVSQWVFLNDDNKEDGISTYGIGFNTDRGGIYGTVKTLDENFGFDKIKEINSNSLLFNTIYNEIIQRKQMKQTNNIIDVLMLKNQIILQGPPGTGKTRMAKEIALNLVRPDSINEMDILQNIIVGKELVTTSETAAFTVSNIYKDRLEYVRKSTGNKALLTFKDIIEAYLGKIWLVKNGITSGSDTYSSTVAKYIYDNYQSSQYNIIQFHPAYSYEDFVRGITAKSNGNSIEYKTENKILTKIAKTALDNYLNSKKEPEQLSKQSWINTKLTSFIELLSKELTENGKIALTSKGFIYEIEDDCLRYKGEDWATPGRINLVDLIKLIEANFGKTIGELIISKEVSVHAWYRTSYYLPILSRFFSHAGVYTSQIVPKELLKSYVLIIDEINRANLPAVLGELIYALEYRGEKVESMYEIEGEGNNLVLPPNLYIIGTMNTADRSVGHIDYAIRRRFAFVDVLPSSVVIDEVVTDVELNRKAKLLYTKVEQLFTQKEADGKIDKYLASDFKSNDVQLGHSYFLARTEAELKLKLEYEIKPLLNEYLKDGILLEIARPKIEEL